MIFAFSIRLGSLNRAKKNLSLLKKNLKFESNKKIKTKIWNSNNKSKKSLENNKISQNKTTSKSNFKDSIK
jgi:hypothetical protein